MNTHNITVVGSYATGLTMKLKRMPTTGETVLGSGYRVDHGGKGSNQAVACARLGAKASFVAKIGNDAFGESALSLYRDEGIDASFVQQTNEQPTGVGFILVEADSGNNCIAFDAGANELLTTADVARSEGAFQSASVVLAQLEIPVEAAEEAMKHGRSCGATTILNPAPVRPLPTSLFQFVDILTPNHTEARVLTGRNPNAFIDPEEVARDLVHMGAKKIVMTLGEEGAMIVDASSVKHVPAVRVPVVDTTGAGDAFNAGITTALAFGASLHAAVEFGVVIGAMAVTKDGVIPSLPRRDEVRRFCRERNLALPDWFSVETAARP
jgi:ribokinase